MRAVVITGHGSNEVVQVVDMPHPIRRRGEALIRMNAAGLNRVDLYMRDSGAGIRHSLPLVMGLDGAGEIVDIDDSETRFLSGQRVVIHPGLGCGRCEFCRRGEHVLCTEMKFLGEHQNGTMAEFICLPVENVFPAPSPLDPVESAALSVAPITAWRMVFTKAQLKPWESVLIFGIGGAVSLAALQLAKTISARVIVTSRDAQKREKALEMGADAAIDSTHDVANQVLELTAGRGVDVVIENVGAAVWSQALKSLVRGGRIITCGATTGDAPSADLRRMFIRQLQVIGSTHGTFVEFSDMLSACERGLFKPVIDTRYAMEDVHSGLDRLESGQQFGKIGIEIVKATQKSAQGKQP
jgi:NADPH:quinone reductase-like Zn-dependent oxidoreductase